MVTTNRSQLQQVADQMASVQAKQVGALANTLYTELVENIKINTIPEIVFKEYFLEYFINVLNGKVEHSPLTLKWLELAGGPYNEVNVIDGNNNVIFTTPGLFSRPEVDNNIINQINFSDIASMYIARSNRLEIDGINYLSQELSGLKTLVSSNTHHNYLKWKLIFDRYTTNKSTAGVKPAQPNTNDALGSILSYD
jgi:hypothetical protein